MADKGQKSRINKFKKKRKNTKFITIFSIIGGLLIIYFIGIGIFGGGDAKNSASSEVVISNPESTGSSSFKRVEISETVESDKTKEENEAEAEEELEESEETDEEKELVEAEPTDEHVVEAYKADWEPVGTTQKGPHTTDYSDGSRDRIEIKQAVVEVTGLNPDNMIEWRVANGGDQKVVATVSNSEKTEIYRVFLSWIDGEGWQPTQLEVLDDVVY